MEWHGLDIKKKNYIFGKTIQVYFSKQQTSNLWWFSIQNWEEEKWFDFNPFLRNAICHYHCTL